MCIYIYNTFKCIKLFQMLPIFLLIFSFSHQELQNTRFVFFTVSLFLSHNDKCFIRSGIANPRTLTRDSYCNFYFLVISIFLAFCSFRNGRVSRYSQFPGVRSTHVDQADDSLGGART